MPAISPEDSSVEVQELRDINAQPLGRRIVGYSRLSGPGWIQGAITLGASTATSSFYLGWKFGYEMLWVQVLGMAMGVVMFAAVARPALFREGSFYRAMGRHVHPAVAFAWALASIVASIGWCLNQYSVAAACLADIGQVAGWIQSPEGLLGGKWMIGGVILALSIPLSWAYGSSRQTGVRFFEHVLKIIIVFMVVCFALVVWKTGLRWGELFRGLIPSSFPVDPDDRTMVLGALGCAVGVNMTFMYPLSLKARGWTRHHLGLARFDLVAGMLLPFSIISTLVVITTANMLGGSPDRPGDPTVVARVMSPLFEGTWLPADTGRVLFDLGIAAMPLSTITVLMVISGLALCEIVGVARESRWFQLGCLLPAIGILGVAYQTPFWLGPLISSFALILLPIAYFGFLVLCNSRAYLGPDLPRGNTRRLWNVALAVVLLLALLGAGLKVWDLLGGLLL